MRRIKLTQNKSAIVDNSDYDKLSSFKWHYVNYSKIGYARRRDYRTKGFPFVRMHHMVLPFMKGYMVDHINGNGLDNRKSNLRLVTKSQNMMNRGKNINNKSGYKGVILEKRNGKRKWASYIWLNSKQIYLGSFVDKHQAAHAYNEGAIKYHGEYAYLNKIK